MLAPFRNKRPLGRVLDLVAAIGPIEPIPKHAVNSIRLPTLDGPLVIGNDAVIVCAGGILLTGFLKTIGIEIETKYDNA